MTRKYKSFGEYLDKTNVISAGVGFATGLAVNKCFSVMIDAFVIDVIRQRTGKGLEKLQVKVGGTRLVYGPTLLAVINLAMVLVVSYIIINMSNRFLGWS